MHQHLFIDQVRELGIPKYEGKFRQGMFRKHSRRRERPERKFYLNLGKHPMKLGKTKKSTCSLL